MTFQLFCKNVESCWLCLIVHEAPGNVRKTAFQFFVKMERLAASASSCMRHRYSCEKRHFSFFFFVKMERLAASASSCMRHRYSCEKRHFSFFVKMWKLVGCSSSCISYRE
ncbi:hypothetical protein T11_8507 [Trichinella zimbabwensis]|uniref:Uncharacterized protein n=1 Tax=Trichinella zimbabwensis TaxID=268475 RepID=A0A0V1GJL8_9BILA|nr:hypothetical protein T11_8507 [Trichinella zimbabwensis]